jgi:hypothetical protein
MALGNHWRFWLSWPLVTIDGFGYHGALVTYSKDFRIIWLSNLMNVSWWEFMSFIYLSNLMNVSWWEFMSFIFPIFWLWTFPGESSWVLSIFPILWTFPGESSWDLSFQSFDYERFLVRVHEFYLSNLLTMNVSWWEFMSIIFPIFWLWTFPDESSWVLSFQSFDYERFLMRVHEFYLSNLLTMNVSWWEFMSFIFPIFWLWTFPGESSWVLSFQSSDYERSWWEFMSFMKYT